MRFRFGLRLRLALALVGVAILGVGLAMLLSNRGVHGEVRQAARARLDRSALHMARAAAVLYEQNGGRWTPESAELLKHLARLDRLSLRVVRPDGRFVSRTGPSIPPEAAASRPVRVRGKTVGRVLVGLQTGELLTPEEQRLADSLDRLHLVAGAIAIVVAMLLALVLAASLFRPLRRIRAVAQRMRSGDLAARVRPTGEPELRAVAEALNELAGSLERQEALRREHVANLAHELRTPVNALLARVEAAQDGLARDPGANLAAMHGEVTRLARLCEDVAQLAEAERPGLLIERRPTDLAAVLSGEAESFRAAFADAGLELAVDAEAAPVLGDRDRLGQIVANLLANALRYTLAGGSVHARSGLDGGRALVEVADTGIGIDRENLPRVFERFWRAERSRSRETGGAGIGLTIAFQLARAHGGTIEIESELGVGSTFRLLLPAAGRAPREEQDRSTGSPSLPVMLDRR